MGDFQRATYAYMIPLDEHGQFHDGNPMEPVLTIYRIPQSGVAKFRRKFPGIKWGVLYNFHESTLDIFKDDDANTGKRKKK